MGQPTLKLLYHPPRPPDRHVYRHTLSSSPPLTQHAHVFTYVYTAVAAFSWIHCLKVSTAIYLSWSFLLCTPVSEMTYTVSSGMLNSTILYYTILLCTHCLSSARRLVSTSLPLNNQRNGCKQLHNFAITSLFCWQLKIRYRKFEQWLQHIDNNDRFL